MADTQYPPNYDPMMNIPIWLTFKYPTGKAGKTKSKGTDYKQFGVEIGGVAHTWWVYNLALAGQVEAILANCRAMNRPMELAYMQTEGEGKAHLHCLSDRNGGLQCTVPPCYGWPQHFANFVGTLPTSAPQSPTGGAVSPQVAAPPLPLACKTMADCLTEAFAGWCAVLEYAYQQKTDSKDPKAEIRDIEFLVLQQAMSNGLAQSAHSIFIESSRNGR